MEQMKVVEVKDNGVTEVVYNDKQANRDRKAYLILVKDGVAYPFADKDIPGVVAIIGHEYYRSGKWSSTDWHLLLKPGTTYFHGHQDFNTFQIVPGVKSWAEVAAKFGCSIASAREAIGHFRPREVKELDEIESKIAEVDDMAAEADQDMKIATLSFGSPCNRAIREGYWDKPKSIPGGEIRKIDLSKGWTESNLEIVGIKGKIIEVHHTSGMHGGYYDIKYAVVPGTEYDYDPWIDPRQQELDKIVHQDGPMANLADAIKVPAAVNLPTETARQVSKVKKAKAEPVRMSLGAPNGMGVTLGDMLAGFGSK